MKKQIRKNIFETNSSSVHSIVIGNNGEDIYKNLPKNLHFAGDEFAWEHEFYNNTQDKANYLFTSLIYTDRPLRYVKRIREVLRKWNIKATFNKIIKDWHHAGYNYKIVSDLWCYIDHGGELKEFVEEVCSDEAKLMNYLFSDGSFVHTSNDNDDYDCDKELFIPNNLLLEYEKGN